ncbi:DUF697 domain-containing protein [Desulfovibrionales bacterium]
MTDETTEKKEIVTEIAAHDTHKIKYRRLAEANHLVNRRVFWAAGAGLVPIPLIDFAILLGLQLDMVRVLANIYNVSFQKDVGKSVVTTLLGSIIPIGLSRPLARLVKFIPIVGQALGVLSMSITNAASTYAVGKVFIQHFESGGTLLDLNPEKMKTYFQEKFDEIKNKSAK